MNPTTVKAKEIIDSGEYGRILSAMQEWLGPHGTYYTESDWRGKYKTEGGGVIINQAIHTIICSTTFAVESERYAIATKLRETDDYEVDDSCMANFGLSNGSCAVGHFTNCYTCGTLAR